MTISEFTALPPEVLEVIFLHLDPTDAARLSQCCQSLRLMLYNPKDQLLWRELYLNLPLDDPRKCISSQGVRRKDSDIDWRFTVQRFVRARTILYNPELAKPGETLNTLRTLLELVTWVPPMEYQYDSDHLSQNLVWVCASLQGRPFLDDIQTDNDASEEEKQLSARLHTYFGLTGMDMTKEGRVRSRAYVYDMRNYTPQNEYGPLNAGGVNWEHIRAIHHVVSMHIMDLQQEENFKLHIFPMSLPATQIVSPTRDADGPAEEVEEQDWIGLSGSWKVSFCFCDHRELLRYNEAVPDVAGNLDTSIFDEPGFGEVFRTLSVTLKTSFCRPDPKHPDRPIINFIGEMPDTTSTMSGTIQMTEDDQVQWKFVRTFGTISGEQGQAVWYSVGIQMGGLLSPYGVLGSWTTVFHDSDDPVGPFWLRRDIVAPNLPMNHVALNAHLIIN